jgi:hypothetical protein
MNFTNLWMVRFGLEKGHIAIQMQQSVPILPQYAKQVSALSDQRSIPRSTFFSLSMGIDFDGQDSPHFKQTSQNFSAPRSAPRCWAHFLTILVALAGFISAPLFASSLDKKRYEKEGLNRHTDTKEPGNRQACRRP